MGACRLDRPNTYTTFDIAGDKSVVLKAIRRIQKVAKMCGCVTYVCTNRLLRIL